MLEGHRASKFIRRFQGPGSGSGIVCFRFWQLVPAGGCPYQCSYCFLQTTPWFRFNPDHLYGLVYTNVQDMIAEIEAWLLDPIPKMLIVGELQDGLVFERAFQKVTGKPLSHWIVPLFSAQERHRLIFLTKSVEIESLLQLQATQQVIVSWSVNAEPVSAKWEIGTPLPSQRFAAARELMKHGWPIRFRLDPMVPYDGWRSGYAEALKQINLIDPEMVTLGALRATSAKSLRAAAKRNGRDSSIFNYLCEERDPSGFKYRLPQSKQAELFRYALDTLSTKIVPALCKEDISLWNKLGLSFAGCHCILGSQDSVVLDSKSKLFLDSQSNLVSLDSLTSTHS